jgi:DNA-binding response OmpR family regulator
MTKDTRHHILVVDDDAQIRLLLRRCFEGEGYRVTEAASGAEALERVAAAPLDLVTLDLGLPGEDGLSVGRAIRARSQVPIVMVTGKGDVVDRVVGLELGADDYIAKPFHVREVLARVRAVLRRSEAVAARPAPAGEVLAFGDWVLDVPRRELRTQAGTVCELTTSEFDLLHAFATHPQRPLTRDQIMDLLRGRDWAPTDRSIDNLVVRLRRKIEPSPDRPTLIKTVRGVGYSFAGSVRTSS